MNSSTVGDLMDVTQLIYAVHDGVLNSLIDYLDAGEAIDEQAFTPLMLTTQKAKLKAEN
jgi:hypothetical protein